LVDLDRQQAPETLVRDHGLDRRAAKNLLDYLHQQREATGEVPSDRTIVIECFFDEVGDWRIVILSPFGARVHAPWATAVAARLQAETAGEVDMMWSDDGIVFRLPESDEPPPVELLLPAADEVEDLVVRQLGSTALFAARFRENAARALLLPRRHPGRRTPLWLQRRRSADLLAVASRYPDFPILLETYRECLRDVFDLRGLKSILRDIEQRVIRVRMERTGIASPFASSVMFNYTANFLYEGDAPLAERRAQTLALDHAQLRELLGDAELRELLDAAAVEELAFELQRLDERYPCKHPDCAARDAATPGRLVAGRIGGAVRGRGGQRRPAGCKWIDGLVKARRVIWIRIAGQRRLAAAEDAARFRDALGVAPPPGLPDAFLESVATTRWAIWFRGSPGPMCRSRPSRWPSGSGWASRRCGNACSGCWPATDCSKASSCRAGTGGNGAMPKCSACLKRRSLAKLRKQIEPVEPPRRDLSIGKVLDPVARAKKRDLGASTRAWMGCWTSSSNCKGCHLPASLGNRISCRAGFRTIGPATWTNCAPPGRSFGADSTASVLATGGSPCTWRIIWCG
jgi:ATP-dependent helicase Lhr and Lhr-like helicase